MKSQCEKRKSGASKDGSDHLEMSCRSTGASDCLISQDYRKKRLRRRHVGRYVAEDDETQANWLGKKRGVEDQTLEREEGT